MHLTKAKPAVSHLSNLNQVTPRYSILRQLTAGLRESLFTPVLSFSDEVTGIIIFGDPTDLCESQPHHLLAM